MLGYMEQSVATALTKALTAVGCFKPKYPFVDAKKSALLYIAYHLKGEFPERCYKFTLHKIFSVQLSGKYLTLDSHTNSVSIGGDTVACSRKWPNSTFITAK